MRARTLKNPIHEKQLFVARSWVALMIIVLLIGVLIARYYRLQIVDHEIYATISDKNRMQLEAVPPTRGLIYDRNGVLLADNAPVFSVTMVRERVKSVDDTLALVSQLIDLSQEEITRFQRRMKQRRRPYESVPIKFNISEEEIARLASSRYRLSGVEVEAELVRHYPQAEVMSHVLGYVGRINEDELKRVDPSKYDGTHYIGKLGVEKFYEELLHGEVGYQTVETNARGRVLRVLNRVDPAPGQDIRLHLDAQLQQAAVDAMAGRRGAVVAIEPKTGGILALVSTPGFNTNLFVTGIDQKNYDAYRNSIDIPLINRAIRGQYPPGSTIKPVMALAGLDTGFTNRSRQVWDPGFFRLPGVSRPFRDWKKWGHGWVDLRESIIQSCDIYYYDLGHRMGVDEMSKYLSYFGLGETTALDVGEASAGVLPSREWKRGARGEGWYPGDTINMSIGQGYMVATPLQLATLASTLANRGKWIAPRLLKEAIGMEVLPLTDTSAQRPALHLKNPDDFEYVIDAMEGVMHAPNGTARASAAHAPYRIAGKTGTAQVIGIAQDKTYKAEELEERHRDHALFIGFAPADDPVIAVAVMVENGGGGSKAAAPVARKVFDAWLLGEMPTATEETTNAEATGD